MIAGHIGARYGHHVRVGAANAGHTVYTPHPVWVEETGGTKPWYEKHVMQQLPCGAYTNTEALLYIGPGALISEDILLREMRTLYEWRKGRGLPPKSVYVDPRAHIIQQAQIDAERDSGLDERIGSTSTIAKEGIGAAQADRVMREEWCVTARDWLNRNGTVEMERLVLGDVPMLLQQAGFDRGGPDSRRVLLEGTQGAGLSLTTGQFPYVTSRNTTAAGLAADCGVGVGRIDRVIMVARMHGPIRVAGPSGPFWPDSQEREWENLGVDAENERTTVTKKVRRTATLSLRQLHEAAILNGATEVALTFADYMCKSVTGMHGKTKLDDLPSILRSITRSVEGVTGAPVTMLGTGPHSVLDIEPAYRPLRAGVEKETK